MASNIYFIDNYNVYDGYIPEEYPEYEDDANKQKNSGNEGIICAWPYNSKTPHTSVFEV